jgi:hypothetical protein
MISPLIRSSREATSEGEGETGKARNEMVGPRWREHHINYLGHVVRPAAVNGLRASHAMPTLSEQFQLSTRNTMVYETPYDPSVSQRTEEEDDDLGLLEGDNNGSAEMIRE